VFDAFQHRPSATSFYDRDFIVIRRLGLGPKVGEVISQDGGVTVSWSPTAGAVSYDLYLAEDDHIAFPYGVSKDHYSMAFTDIQSPFTVSGLENGRKYKLVMTAIYHNGDEYYSADHSFIYNSVPKNVRASAGDGLVTLFWDKYPDNYPQADSYYIYMASESGVTKGNWEYLADGARFHFTNAPIPEYFKKFGLENDKTYYFVVTLYNGDESSESSEVAATPTQGATAAATFEATVISGSSHRLRGIIQNPDGYETEVWFEYGTDKTYGATTSSKIFSARGEKQFQPELLNLAENTIYHYRFVSRNSTGIYVGEDKTFRNYLAPQLVTGGLVHPGGLVFDGQHLYWRDYPNRLMRLQVSSNQSSVLATENTGLNASGHVSITMDSNHLYWADNRVIHGENENNIWKVGLDGNGLMSSALFQEFMQLRIVNMRIHPTGLYIACAVKDLSLSPTYLYKMRFDDQAVTMLYGDEHRRFSNDFEVDATSIYFGNDQYLQKIPLDGGSVTTLAEKTGWVHEILLDAGTIYFSDSAGIKKVSINGGSVTTIADISGPFVKDGENLYVASDLYVAGGSTISKVNLSDGVVETLVIGQRGLISSPVTDANYIYWLANDAIRKISKH
jgi:hypothetical protein